MTYRPEHAGWRRAPAPPGQLCQAGTSSEGEGRLVWLAQEEALLQRAGPGQVLGLHKEKELSQGQRCGWNSAEGLAQGQGRCVQEEGVKETTEKRVSEETGHDFLQKKFPPLHGGSNNREPANAYFRQLLRSIWASSV